MIVKSKNNLKIYTFKFMKIYNTVLNDEELEDDYAHRTEIFI